MFNDFSSYQKSLDTRRRSEPARSYLWAVELPDLLISPSVGKKSTSFVEAENASQTALDTDVDMSLLNSLVTSIVTPFSAVETNKVIDGSSFWYEATNDDISNITITVEEQQSGIAKKYFDNWMSLVIHPSGRRNPPAFYKREIKFYRLDLSKMVFETTTYSGYFLTEVSPISNTYSENGILEYSATFTGDTRSSKKVATRAETEAAMEAASSKMGAIEIPYDPFKFAGVPTKAISELMGSIATRIGG